MCSHCNCFLAEDNIWWIVHKHRDSGHNKKHCHLWCAACGVHYNWRDPNRVLIGQGDAEAFRTFAPSLFFALKLQVNLHMWQRNIGEPNVRMRAGKRQASNCGRIEEVHQGQQPGDSEWRGLRRTEVQEVMRPKFYRVADELTLRAEVVSQQKGPWPTLASSTLARSILAISTLAWSVLALFFHQIFFLVLLSVFLLSLFSASCSSCSSASSAFSFCFFCCSCCLSSSCFKAVIAGA